MISTRTFIRAQAEAYATERIDSIPELQSPIFADLREALRSQVRAAFMRGADAGYSAAKAEERKP